MAVNQVPGVGQALAAVAAQPVGISAKLAEARSQLRAATADDSWERVFDEVRRLQAHTGMPLLDALHEIYQKVANGWKPPAG